MPAWLGDGELGDATQWSLLPYPGLGARPPSIACRRPTHPSSRDHEAPLRGAADCGWFRNPQVPSNGTTGARPEASRGGYWAHVLGHASAGLSGATEFSPWVATAERQHLRVPGAHLDLLSCSGRSTSSG